ncbi:MAG: Tagatose 1,6-diphosphate aldolase [Peptostreptococcus russellii]
MLKLTENKKKLLEKLSNKDNVIAALAIDQRGAIKKMIAKIDESLVSSEFISDFKVAVSEELTKYSSSILLDPEFGLEAAKRKDKEAGLLIAYEKTGYDATEKGRLPDLLPIWSAKRLKEEGADAVKILLYYDVDEENYINDQKKAFVERVGSECIAEDIPYFLEIVTYSCDDLDVKGKEYAKIKPRKVIEAMKEFSDERYAVDVLKVEVPVNMDYVESYSNGEILYSRQEALDYFKKQSDATDLPFIFLSAGVSAELFKETLRFAHEAGSKFNGVLCGRATWADGLPEYVKSIEGGREWLRTQGKENIESLNDVLKETATSWSEKL